MTLRLAFGAELGGVGASDAAASTASNRQSAQLTRDHSRHSQGLLVCHVNVPSGPQGAEVEDGQGQGEQQNKDDDDGCDLAASKVRRGSFVEPTASVCRGLVPVGIAAIGVASHSQDNGEMGVAVRC